MIDLITNVTTIAAAPTTHQCIPAAAKAAGNATDYDYAALVARVQGRFEKRLEDGAHLFTTDADLWPVYLGAFPSELRPHHDCHACRHFLRAYGGLAVINDQGRVSSALWDTRDENTEYAGVLGAMANAVAKARVTGVFLSSDPVWGSPTTKQWIHLAIRQELSRIYRVGRLTAAQAMAEKAEDHKNVMRALHEFTPEVVGQALALLESDALYRAEKVIGPVRFLADLHAAARIGSRTNVVWRAVASAPAGFCHPRSSMAGTLLDDLARGVSFAEVSRRFSAKMHPLQYQRPTAAPSAGQVRAAEDLVAKLGIAASLRRRFARLDECETLWKPTSSVRAGTGGVFEHLIPKNRPMSLDVPPQRITWSKFASTVLPETRALYVNITYGKMPFAALVTAADPDAPAILQWGNPVSWYLYNGGSIALDWGVAPGWEKVNAVVPSPTNWNGGTYTHQGNRVFLIVDGAHDRTYARAGLALFPEILKSELHGARSVIEAHSRSGVIEGHAESSACGIMIGDVGEVRVRATTRAGNRHEYIIDRWD